MVGLVPLEEKLLPSSLSPAAEEVKMTFTQIQPCCHSDCCLSHPGYGDLLGPLKLTKTSFKAFETSFHKGISTSTVQEPVAILF